MDFPCPSLPVLGALGKVPTQSHSCLAEQVLSSPLTSEEIQVQKDQTKEGEEKGGGRSSYGPGFDVLWVLDFSARCLKEVLLLGFKDAEAEGHVTPRAAITVPDEGGAQTQRQQGPATTHEGFPVSALSRVLCLPRLTGPFLRLPRRYHPHLRGDLRPCGGSVTGPGHVGSQGQSWVQCLCPHRLSTDKSCLPQLTAGKHMTPVHLCYLLLPKHFRWSFH